MREIKFRSWVEHESSSEELNSIYPYMQENPEFHGSINEIFKENSIEPENPYACKITYMQYTGLKDKNGREIYEGDIIVDGSVPGPEYGIGGYMFTKYEVKMVNGCFVVECIPDCVNDHVFGNYHLLYEVITDGFAEVVGNIYENPELLEVKTNNHKTV